MLISNSIKSSLILSKKINGEKQNQYSSNHSVSSVHNNVQQVLTNSPALLLHLLLKSNKFQFKNVCDTSLIFNTMKFSKLVLVAFVSSVFFVSCTDDDNTPEVLCHI